MTRLVVLDAVPLDQGDVDWEPFRRLGDLVLHERTAPGEVVERCRGADVVLSNKVVLDATVIDACDSVRCIQVMATGTNIVDLEAASRRGIRVLNVPAYSTGSVVQHAWALILELVRGVGAHSEDARNGGWAESNDFSFFRGPLRDLQDLTLGIVGHGDIGRGIADVARAFDMRVVVAAIPGRPAETGRIPLDELLPTVDILSVSCPLTDLTNNLIDERRLRLMKRDAWLVNTSRGAVIDEAALARVLAEGHLAGAGLDVLTAEPPPADHPLLTSPRTILTPHVAWGSERARRTLMTMMLDNVRNFLEESS